MTEVLLLMLKGFECIQSFLCAYVTMNENINWRSELVSDGAFFPDDEIFGISSV